MVINLTGFTCINIIRNNVLAACILIKHKKLNSAQHYTFMQAIHRALFILFMYMYVLYSQSHVNFIHLFAHELPGSGILPLI